MISARRALQLLSLFSVVLPAAQSADWPQWRGPLRTGHVPENEPVPASLPAEPKIVWRLKVGEGLASPVVAGDRLFYFDAQESKETLHAIQATTARELWRATIDDTFRDTQGPAGPRCTPVVDGDRVYAQSCRGELQCLNVADGGLLWHVNYAKDFGAVFIGEKGSAAGASRHGNNGSPLVDGGHLIASVGSTNGAGVVCFDKRTGRVIWKSQNDQAAYAPPIIATLAGARQIIVFNASSLIGLASDTGALLWRVPLKTALGRHVTTPVVADDIVAVGSHQIGLIGVKISKTENGFKAEQAWLDRDEAINFSSPVVVGHYLYGLGPTKNLICVDVRTGQIAWSRNGYFSTPADKAHAGFLVMGNKLLVLTDGGELLLLAADPSAATEISRVQVCGLNWCNPAYVDGKLFVRDGVKTTGDLLCVDLLP
ncbi:MAG: outer membrane protein assembly factor BamB family protein [Limisphaerales bacterium]